MSPLSATCLLLLGAGMASANWLAHRKKPLFAPLVLGSAVFMIGALKALSAFLPTPLIVEWGATRPTSTAAAISLAILGATLMLFIWRKALEWRLSRQRFVTARFAHGLVACTLLFWQVVHHHDFNAVAEDTAVRVQAEARGIAQALQTRVGALARLGEVLQRTPKMDDEDWRALVDSYRKDFPDVYRVSLVDGDSKIDRIHPLNEVDRQLLGRPLNAEPLRKAALEDSRRTGQPAVSAELRLYNAKVVGFIIATPLYRQGRFIGHLVGVMRTGEFLQASRGYDRYELSLAEGGREVFSTAEISPRMKEMWGRQAAVPSPHVQWVVSMTPSFDRAMEMEGWMPLLALLGGIAISILFLFTLHHWAMAREQSEKSQAMGQQLQMLTDIAPVGIFRTDPSNSKFYFNAYMEDLMGMKSSEAGAAGWERAIHPDDLARVREEWYRATSLGQPFTLYYRFRRPDGEVRWVHGRGIPLRNAKGQNDGYIGAVQDFTRQKQYEEELRENRNFLATVLDNLPVSLFCKDSADDFKFTLWNRHAEKVFGLRQAEVLGKNDYDLFPTEQADFFRRKDRETLGHGTTVDIPEETVYSPSLGEVFLHTTKVPIQEKGGRSRFLLAIATDITEKKRAEALIESQRLQILQAEKMQALGQMAGGMAHEINNPLAVLELVATQLQGYADRGSVDPAKLQKSVDTISVTVDRIAKIIRGLRSFARDGAHDPLVVAPLRKVIEETLDFCQARFGVHRVTVRAIDVPKECQVECRPTQLSQVILNLLNNAFDAVQASTENPWIEISARENQGFVEIRVSNSGPKISPDIAKRIMEPFFTTKGNGGTGLGLSISQVIVQSHGGALTLDELAPHTCFLIRFPLQQMLRSYGTEVNT